MYEHGDDLGPKMTKMEDNKPFDIPYNQPLDNISPQKKISGKYCNLAYEMHIGNWKILSPGGMTLDSNGGKALELRLTGAVQVITRAEIEAGWDGNNQKLSMIFDF